MRIEDGYPSNPYHCRTHAADVLRMMHLMLDRGGVMQVGGDIQYIQGEMRVGGRRQGLSFCFHVCKLIHTLGGTPIHVCLSQNGSIPSCNTLCCRKVRYTLFSAATAACQCPAPYCAIFLSAPQAVVDSALPPAAATTMVYPHCDVETFEERLSQPSHNEPQVRYG